MLFITGAWGLLLIRLFGGWALVTDRGTGPGAETGTASAGSAGRSVRGVAVERSKGGEPPADYSQDALTDLPARMPYGDRTRFLVRFARTGAAKSAHVQFYRGDQLLPHVQVIR